LQQSVEKERKNKNKQHDVWELSFDRKRCDTEAFIIQKLDYFHSNPCKGKWNLCESPVEYLHSSATLYITGEQGIYIITGYREVMDIDLTQEWSNKND
jgi:hypothetical protein